MIDHATALPGLMRFELVDATSQHVFVSLPDTSKVAVLDFSGNLVHTIANEAGARGLAVVGTTLYVAATTAGEIDEFDTSTFANTGTLATGITGMDYLASAGGALWVVPSSTGELTRVSLADGSTEAFSNPLGAVGKGLVTDPANANLIAEFLPIGDPTTVAIVDVSGTPTALAQRDLADDQFGNAQDLAWSPDGSSIFPASAGPYQYVGLDSGTLADTGVVYPGEAYPTAVATTSANGGLFAGGMDAAGSDVLVYRLGDPSAPIAAQSWSANDYGYGDRGIEPGGLRFSPDGTHIFAISGDAGIDFPTDTFHVLTIAGATVPSPFALSSASESFGDQRVGTYGLSRTVSVRNASRIAATITGLGVAGTDPDDFFGSTTCHVGTALAAGKSCSVTVYFGALALGSRRATLVVLTSNSSASVTLNGAGTEGYYLADSRGQVDNFGDAIFVGSAGGQPLAAPIISMTTTPNGDGFWLLARDGGVFSFGNAVFHGSTGAMRLNRPIVGMASTPTGRGYWLVASDGGIFAFGDARFYGSTGAIRLNQPVVGMAATPTGHGYWLVASDGGIFSFGDARFYGSTGAIHLNRPIIAMTSTPTGRGYRFVANDGGVFSFGDAAFYGSAAASRASIVGLASTPDGRGYWLVSNTGQVFHYGNAPFYGDAREAGVTDVIGLAGTAPMLPPALLGATSSASSGFLALRSLQSTTLRARTR